MFQTTNQIVNKSSINFIGFEPARWVYEPNNIARWHHLVKRKSTEPQLDLEPNTTQKMDINMVFKICSSREFRSLKGAFSGKRRDQRGCFPQKVIMFAGRFSFQPSSRILPFSRGLWNGSCLEGRFFNMNKSDLRHFRCRCSMKKDTFWRQCGQCA